MISIGTSITAAGAIKYFKNDLENQTSEEADRSVLKTDTSDEDDSGNGHSAPPVDDGSVSANGFILNGTLTRWQGSLAEEFGLRGKVTQEEFNRLCRGRHPHTNEQLIRHVQPRTKIKRSGKKYLTKSHRAGLDQTINAPKSVTLVAMKDTRVIEAHLKASVKAIKTAEEFTTAKMGNIKPPEKTGKALYAMFLHFDTRPDGKTGQVSPGMHCHFFEFNFTKTSDLKRRALELRENFRSQKLVTAVYRSELHKEMTALGYQMRVDEKTRAPEVASINRDFIEATSPRQNEIIEKARELNIKSTKTVAANYRQKKKSDKSEMIESFEKLEKSFDFQAATSVEIALRRSSVRRENGIRSDNFNENFNPANKQRKKAAEAMDFAVEKARQNKTLEKKRRKLITHQSILADALEFGVFELTIREVKEEFTKRYDRGELDEFDLDRRFKSAKNTESSIQRELENKAFAAPQKIDKNNEEENNENSKTTGFAKPSLIRLDDENDSASLSEFGFAAERRISSGNKSEFFADKNDKSSFSDSGKSFAGTIKKSDGSKPDPGEQNSAVDQSSGRKSAESSGEAESSRTQTSEPRRSGRDDQTDRSGKEVESNQSDGDRDKEKNKFDDCRVELELSEKTGGDTELGITHQRTSVGEIWSGAKNIRSGKTTEEGKFGISHIRKMVEKYQRRNIQRIGNQRPSDNGKTNSEDRSIGNRFNEFAERKFETENTDRFDTGTNRQGEKRGSIERTGNRTPVDVGDDTYESGDTVSVAHSGNNVLQLHECAGFDTTTGGGEREIQETGSAVFTGSSGEKQQGTNFFGHHHTISKNVSGRERLLQTKTGGPAQAHSKIVEETNRAAAAKTAQVINVKLYGGQLNARIIKEWAKAIEKVSAEQVLSEILKTPSKEEKEKTEKLLDKQAELFAGKLNIPKPRILTESDEDLLADKLTEFEVRNYEEATGEQIGDKTFEILSERNSLLSKIPPSDEDKKEIEEIFKNLPAAPEFNSALEAQTFIGFMHPQSVGFNDELIERTQKAVSLNEAASRETATLVQIAYGGQLQIFDDNFRQVLADEIYYTYRSPLEAYNYFAKSDWQKTIEVFAPVMESIAKQNELIINPPENGKERNKFLADFVTAQFIEAYRSQNDDLQKWTETRLNNEFQKLGNVEANKNQKDDIENYSSSDRLKAPEFSSGLEAEAYRLSKYDDDEKTGQAKRLISQVEEITKIEIKAALIERENAQSMSM